MLPKANNSNAPRTPHKSPPLLPSPLPRQPRQKGKFAPNSPRQLASARILMTNSKANRSCFADASFVDRMERHLLQGLPSAKAILGDFIASTDFQRFIESPPAEAARAGPHRWVVPVGILPDRLMTALKVQTRILRLKGSVAWKQQKSPGDRSVALYAILQTLLDTGKRCRDREWDGKIVVQGHVNGKGYRSVLEKEENVPVLVSLFHLRLEKNDPRRRPAVSD